MRKEVRLLEGSERLRAVEMIRRFHYTHSVPAGKSYYLSCGFAIVVWSIPANKNIARFLVGRDAVVWELARLWAPDGHDRNLLTWAISSAVGWIAMKERPDGLVSYADPNAGHLGGVYRAASWSYHGQCDKTRMYKRGKATLARRSFHSGSKGMTKAEIEALGYREICQPGKHRFVKPLARWFRHALENSSGG